MDSVDITFGVDFKISCLLVVLRSSYKKVYRNFQG